MRAQQGIWPVQTRREYALRALKFAGLRVLGHPRVYWLFARSIAAQPTIKGPLGSSGYYKVMTIRGGLPALISVANGGAPWSVEWLENGIDVMVAGNTAIGDRVLSLAARV